MTDFDVIIAGGGLAGAASAIVLRQHWPSCRIALIEQQQGRRPRIGETLAPQCAPILQQLGLWQAFIEQDFAPANGNQALWENDEVAENPYIYSPFGHGWHIDRARFDALVLSAAEQRGAEIFNHHRLTSVSETEQGFEVRLAESDDCLRSNFFIDASGRKARFARMLGAHKEKLDRLIGVAATCPSVTGGVDSTTLVEACADGWWYAACQPNGEQIIVFMTDADIARVRAYRKPENWLACLRQTRAIQRRIQPIETTPKLNIYAAESHRLTAAAGVRWLAVGDAASAFDPLSSLGMLKALRSGVLAAYALKDAAAGDSVAMAKYRFVCAREYQGYLETRGQYYRLVEQYGAAPFWRRRAQVLNTIGQGGETQQQHRYANETDLDEASDEELSLQGASHVLQN